MTPIVSVTTENTFLFIGGTLFVPCEIYSISILPYQMVSSGIDEGIPVHIFEEYPGGKFISYLMFLYCIQFILTQTYNEQSVKFIKCVLFLALPVANSIMWLSPGTLFLSV